VAWAGDTALNLGSSQVVLLEPDPSLAETQAAVDAQATADAASVPATGAPQPAPTESPTESAPATAAPAATPSAQGSIVPLAGTWLWTYSEGTGNCETITPAGGVFTMTVDPSGNTLTMTREADAVYVNDGTGTYVWQGEGGASSSFVFTSPTHGEGHFTITGECAITWPAIIERQGD
jgi:hypothetical protein